MRLFTWTSELATGIDVIDEQHREVGHRVNSFLKHCADGSCSERRLMQTFMYLHEYVEKHFSLEEKLMIEFEYPEARLHINAHQRFRRWVEETRAHLEERGQSIDFLLKTNYVLLDHLEEHYKVVDRKMSDFLVKQSRKRLDKKLIALVAGLFGHN